MECHIARRDRLRSALAKTGAEALLVTSFTNVTYLTGFSGDDSYLLLHRDGDLLLSDPRYTTQLGEECPGLELHIRNPGVSQLLSTIKVLRSARIRRLAIEGDSMTVGMRERIAEKLPKLEMLATSGLVEKLRQIKDKGEIAQLRQAVQCAEKAFAVVRAGFQPEKTEKEIADELEMLMRRFGASRARFRRSWASGRGPRCRTPCPAITAWAIAASC